MDEVAPSSEHIEFVGKEKVLAKSEHGMSQTRVFNCVCMCVCLSSAMCSHPILPHAHVVHFAHHATNRSCLACQFMIKLPHTCSHIPRHIHWNLLPDDLFVDVLSWEPPSRH